MPGKDPSQYNLDEVCVWLNAIGLGGKTDAFRENAIDGKMLVILKDDDFSELGLSSLQGKKVIRYLEFSQELANEAASGGDPSKLKALEKENTQLKNENVALKAQLKEYAPKPAPPSSRPPSKPKPAGAPVIRGAAGGAARGAILGAVGGAIAGDAGKGAKIGAAMGGTAGGMQGLGARRRARLRRGY